MTSFVQSNSTNTQQALIGPGDNVAIDINGKSYPVNFTTNGGATNVSLNNSGIYLENFGSAIGTAAQLQLPIGGQTKKFNIMCHEIGSGGTSYRLITWSIY